jgi:biopolymer transport protein ExbD
MIDWEEMPELNITPLVDVMLVLMAILMVSAPVFVYEEKVDLPLGSKSVQEQPVEKLEFLLNSNREVLYGDHRATVDECEEFVKRVTEGKDSSLPVIIKGDKSLSYDDIMKLLVAVKHRGFTKVSLSTHG